MSTYSAAYAWAVGGSLILHWNGRSWVQAANPVAASALQATAAVSATDAWTVGQYCSPQCAGAYNTLILHWNGKSWSKVASPVATAAGSDLYGVTATSASSAWAVGLSETPSADQFPLIVHWNGKSWSKVPVPLPAEANEGVLYGVAATSADNVWAVGSLYSHGSLSLILHWNGTTWSRVASPSPGTDVTLTGVSASSGTNAWAVGSYFTPTSAIEPLILHWNGTNWSRVASPAPGGASGATIVASVSIGSATSAWAVGHYATSSSPDENTLILHWNGTTWSTVPSPDPGKGGSLLSGVRVISATNAWAVGYSVTASSESDALILHWNGTAWSSIAMSLER